MVHTSGQWGSILFEQVHPQVNKILIAVVHNHNLRGPTSAGNEMREEYRAGTTHTRKDNRDLL